MDDLSIAELFARSVVPARAATGPRGLVPHQEDDLSSRRLWPLAQIEDVVRAFAAAEAVVNEAIQLKVPAVWMQEDVIHERAAEKARQAGIFVVMDLCILKEHRARIRGISGRRETPRWRRPELPNHSQRIERPQR